MKETFKVQILSTTFVSQEHIQKQRDFMTHSVQKIERIITQCFKFSCGHVVPVRYVKVTKSGSVTCEECRRESMRK